MRTIDEKRAVTDKPDRDGKIRAAIKRDDPKALEMIWECYSDDLLAFLTANLRSRHDGEEVLQNLFVKIARDRRRLGRAGNVRAYLFTAARNAAIDYRRKAKPGVPLDSVDFGLVAEEAEAMPDADEKQAVAAALARLPAEQREVVILKIYRDMTFREIAAAVGTSLNTTASRYRYALEKLGGMLETIR